MPVIPRLRLMVLVAGPKVGTGSLGIDGLEELPSGRPHRGNQPRPLLGLDRADHGHANDAAAGQFY